MVAYSILPSRQFSALFGTELRSALRGCPLRRLEDSPLVLCLAFETIICSILERVLCFALETTLNLIFETVLCSACKIVLAPPLKQSSCSSSGQSAALFGTILCYLQDSPWLRLRDIFPVSFVTALRFQFAAVLCSTFATVLCSALKAVIPRAISESVFCAAFMTTLF